LLQGVDADWTFAGRRDAAILRLFIDTGARRAEVANLRWVPAEPDTNDVDLDSGLVRVLVRISLNWPRQSARNGHPGSGFWPPPRRPRQRPTRGVALIP